MAAAADEFRRGEREPFTNIVEIGRNEISLSLSLSWKNPTLLCITPEDFISGDRDRRRLFRQLFFFFNSLMCIYVVGVVRLTRGVGFSWTSFFYRLTAVGPMQLTNIDRPKLLSIKSLSESELF